MIQNENDFYILAIIIHTIEIAKFQNKIKCKSLHNGELSFCCRNEKSIKSLSKDDKGIFGVTLLS